MKCKVEITQIFRCERRIVIDVEAADNEDALENIDTPAFNDPGWREDYDLQNEEIRLKS